MKNFNSALNIRIPQTKSSLTNLFLSPTNLSERNYNFYSPSFHTQLVSIPSSENITRKPLSRGSLEGSSGKKEKSNINIQLNIQNEIIHHNYNPQQLSQDKHLFNPKLTEKEMIESKNTQISRLRKELLHTKYQISLLLNEKNTKRLLDKIELSNCFLNKRAHMSHQYRKSQEGIFPSSSSGNMIKSVKHLFRKSLMFKNTQSAKDKRSLNRIVSPHVNGAYNHDNTKAKHNSTKEGSNQIIVNSMECLHKRAANVLNNYLESFQKSIKSDVS